MQDTQHLLHEAIFANNEDTARKHILEEINVDQVSPEGWSPLHLCAQMGNITIAKWLINAGAKVNNKNENGVTPLHSCCWSNAYEMAELFIKHGANVNAKDNLQWTPLMLAAWSNHDDLVDLLVKNGASINVRNRNNSTALHLAAYNDCTLAIESLLKHKANVNMQNKDGMAPIDIAIKRNNKDCEEILHRAKSRSRASSASVATPIKVDRQNYIGKTAEVTEKQNKKQQRAATLNAQDKAGQYTGQSKKTSKQQKRSDKQAAHSNKPKQERSGQTQKQEKQQAGKPEKPDPRPAKSQDAQPKGRQPTAVATPAQEVEQAVVPMARGKVGEDAYYRDIFFLLDKPEQDMVFLTELTKEQAKLSSDGNQEPPVFPEQLINVTLGGEKVRRKSEVVIANLLYSLDLHYVYERKLCGTVLVGINYPAFTVFCPDDTIIIWEHVSALETDEKKRQFEQLTRWYKQNGFIENKNFFISKDNADGGVDSQAIWEVAEKISSLAESAGEALTAAEVSNDKETQQKK